MACVEQLGSGHFRITKMVHGVRYRKTVDIPVRPSKELAEAIIKPCIPTDIYRHKPLPAQELVEAIIRSNAENSGVEKKRRNWTKQATFVYAIINSENGRIKIGVTSDVGRRVRDLKTSCGTRLYVLGKMLFANRKEAFAREKELHEMFGEYRVKVDGNTTEWFENCILTSVIDCFCAEVVEKWSSSLQSSVACSEA